MLHACGGSEAFRPPRMAGLRFGAVRATRDSVKMHGQGIAAPAGAAGILYVLCTLACGDGSHITRMDRGIRRGLTCAQSRRV